MSLPGPDAPHDRLHNAAPITIDQPGYVYIYFSNENGDLVEVFFDDFEVEHVHGEVVQMDDYYPFGVVFNSYSSENAKPQNYKSNGKELQEELSIGWYDYQARQYDPFTGRWTTVDPLSEVSRRWSPYVYCYDNPIRFIDPDGMRVEDPYILFNGDEKKMEVWDDNDTPDDYSDDFLLSANDAKNEVASNSNGKWEDGEYAMVDDTEPHTHGDATSNGVVMDSDNGAYGSGGIYRAENFQETTTDKVRTGMGIHAGRENQDWDTGRKTMGCIRVKPEGFDAIGDAIEQEGALTKIIVQNNRNSDNSETVNAIKPGGLYRAQAENAHLNAVEELLKIID